MQMATTSGNKVGISKRRQNNNEEGGLKRYDDTVTKKASTQMQSSSKGNENDKAVKLISERNDSSTRVSSKLSSLQMFSAVISLLEGGPVGLRIDGSVAPSTTILRTGNRLRCIVETF